MQRYLGIQNFCLGSVEEIKFLGILLGRKLDFKSHIEKITSKLAKIRGISYRIKSSVPSSTLILFYNSLVLPQITYAIVAWKNSGVTVINSIKYV